MKLTPTSVDIARTKKIVGECPDATLHAAYLQGMIDERERAAHVVLELGSLMDSEHLADRILRGPVK